MCELTVMNNELLALKPTSISAKKETGINFHWPYENATVPIRLTPQTRHHIPSLPVYNVLFNVPQRPHSPSITWNVELP